jgi:hypothetical protein
MPNPKFSALGPDAAYQPKTTDEAGNSTAGGVVVHVNAQQSGDWKTAPAADQDPVFNHPAGKKVTVSGSASTPVLTPPAGCKYVRFSCEGDVIVNTDGADAVDDGTSIRIVAGPAETIPVRAGVEVRARSLSGVATIVRATPMKARG